MIFCDCQTKRREGEVNKPLFIYETRLGYKIEDPLLLG